DDSTEKRVRRKEATSDCRTKPPPKESNANSAAILLMSGPDGSALSGADRAAPAPASGNRRAARPWSTAVARNTMKSGCQPTAIPTNAATRAADAYPRRLERLSVHGRRFGPSARD